MINLRLNKKGVALVTALIMTMAIMIMATGALFFINVSSSMSGAGKRYSTAVEASDGAVNLAKDTINLTLWGESPDAGIFPGGNCLINAIINQNVTCPTTVNLPGVMGDYTANITVTRLYSVPLAGGRLEFPPSGGGAPKTAVFFRITTSVVGPDNATAENSVLYRFSG